MSAKKKQAKRSAKPAKPSASSGNQAGTKAGTLTDKNKTKAQLTEELIKLRRQNSRLKNEKEKLNHAVAQSIDQYRQMKGRKKELQKLFESPNDAIFILDIDGNFIDVNCKAY